MSVTFAAAMAPIIGFDLACVCGARYLTEADEPMPYEVALATLLTVRDANEGLADCEDEDCFTFGIFTKPVEDGEDSPEVQMSNTNAVAVLETLGLKATDESFEDTCCGAISGEDLMGRILVALAIAPESAERPTLARVNEAHTYGAEAHAGAVMVTTGPTMIQCGVEAGYVQAKLEALRAVAEFCIEQDREVVWA